MNGYIVVEQMILIDRQVPCRLEPEGLANLYELIAL